MKWSQLLNAAREASVLPSTMIFRGSCRSCWALRPGPWSGFLAIRRGVRLDPSHFDAPAHPARPRRSARRLAHISGRTAPLRQPSLRWVTTIPAPAIPRCPPLAASSDAACRKTFHSSFWPAAGGLESTISPWAADRSAALTSPATTTRRGGVRRRRFCRHPARMSAAKLGECNDR